MNLSEQYLAILRGQPHKTNLWLSIYQPRTIVTARITGTYDIGSTEIYFYGFSGSSSDLYADLTVLVGTQPNQQDKGRIRYRSFSGTYFTVAENSIEWQNGQYLTFIDYVDVVAVYPKIIQDPNNQTNVIFYKDDDIPYSNQNEIYGTFPNAGPHRATFLMSGTAQIFYTASGTYNVRGDSLSYLWTFDGGTPTGSTSETPGYVSYSQAGHYKTRLRVTSSSGAIDDTYRYVSVYDRPENGTNVPLLRWEMSEFTGSRSEGGYTVGFRVFDDVSLIEPNALVVIFADTWYGGTKINLGGNALNNSSIVFVGYILDDTIHFNYRESYVEFAVGSVSEVMKLREGFSVSCESKADPSTWFELQEMTVPKAIYHYLRWHSTVLKTTDFQYIGDDRLVQYFDADRGSLFDAVDSFMRDSMLGSVVADRQGKLWSEISSFGLETPFVTIPRGMTLHKQDWMNEPIIQEKRNTEMSFVELGGIAYYGVSSNTFSALISNAPSTTPLYHGKSDRKEGLILLSQAQLNRICGNYLAHFNGQFPNITMDLSGFYANLDIAPQERLFLVIDSNDSVRRKSIQDIPYIVEGMEWNYSSQEESFLPQMTLAQIATGTGGVTVQIPVTPPDSGYSLPDLELPPLEPFGDVPPEAVPSYILLHDQVAGLIWTDNFDSTQPSYLQMNGGLTQTQYQAINFMFITPNGSVYAGKANTDVGGGCFVARASALGQPFTILYDEATLRAGPGRAGIFAAGFDPEQPERVALVMERNSEGQTIYVGNGVTFSAGAVIANTNFRGSISFGLGVWLYTTYDYYARVSATGASVLGTGSPNISLQHFRGSSVSGRTISMKNDGTNRWLIGENNLASTTLIDDTNLRIEGMATAISPDALLLMAAYNNGGARGKSSDGGSSWGLLPTLPPLTEYIWCYAGNGGDSPSSTRWVAAASVIRFSPDFGNTWLNKEGNYSTIVIVPDINMAFVPGITQITSTDLYT